MLYTLSALSVSLQAEDFAEKTVLQRRSAVAMAVTTAASTRESATARMSPQAVANCQVLEMTKRLRVHVRLPDDSVGMTPHTQVPARSETAASMTPAASSPSNLRLHVNQRRARKRLSAARR
ncbi:unnamed protein product [Peronospora belbahrii]|uniref:Secreted protein n=1 Tax=Peronospora belbahrii TaxID=622444 RepID=A0ABN8D7Y7_9STRA|nr:unnamed protein product [Peronospora belbahrii]